MKDQNKVLLDCVAILRQGMGVLEKIDDDLFSAFSYLSPRGSIGAHFRHILDFYDCFLAGCGQRRVNYNNRARDRRLEQQRAYALEKIERTIDCLEKLDLRDAHQPLLVNMENSPSWCRSSVLRELDFLLSHTIHHYSLIAMLLRMHEIDPGEEFGVAPSTLNYWRLEAACAQ